LLLVWRLFRAPSALRLTPGQHLAAFGQGVFVFALNYGFVYAAEERIVSAVVAVAYASLAFLNTVLFRSVLGQRTPRAAWLASALASPAPPSSRPARPFSPRPTSTPSPPPPP